MIIAPRRRSLEQGSILIVVVVVVMLVTFACYRFVDVVGNEHRSVAAQADTAQLRATLQSAELYLMTIGRQPPEMRAELEVLADNPQLFRGRWVGGPIRKTRFTILSPQIREGRASGVRFGLVDESTRLSLAAVAAWELESPGAGRRALLELPGMTPQIATEIVRYLIPGIRLNDQIEEGSPLGPTANTLAGGNTRGGRDSAGRIAPATFGSGRTSGGRGARPVADSLSADGVAFRQYSHSALMPRRVRACQELLLVPGVTRSLLFGPDQNYNYSVAPHEIERGDRGASMATTATAATLDSESAPWAFFLCPYSAERNVDRSGRERVNLNTPDLATLEQQLAERFSSEIAEYVLAYRNYGPAVTASSSSGNSASVGGRTSKKGHIGSVYDLVGTEVFVGEDEETGRTLESPFQTPILGQREMFLAFADGVTTTKAESIPHRININTAAVEVLRGIPFVDATLVERILAVRSQSISAADSNRYHPAWLLAEDLISVDWMRKLEPYITARGDVLRGQIVAFEETTRRTLRQEIVVDASHELPRTIFRNDLSRLGAGFDRTLLMEEQEEGVRGQGSGVRSERRPTRAARGTGEMK